MPDDDPPDDRRWEKEAVDAQHLGLENVRKQAEAWEKSIAALLGAFGLVAFVKGPEALKDIPRAAAVDWELFGVQNVDPARTVVLLIFVAAALAGLAILHGAMAAQGIPRWYELLDGQKLKAETQRQAKSAVRSLMWSRVAAVAAALALIAGTGMAWIAELDAADKAPTAKGHSALLISADRATCGQLESKDGVVVLTTDSGEVPIVGNQSLVLVDECP